MDAADATRATVARAYAVDAARTARVAAADAPYVYAARVDMARGAQANLIREIAGNPWQS